MSVDGILNDSNILRHFVLRNIAEHNLFLSICEGFHQINVNYDLHSNLT